MADQIIKPAPVIVEVRRGNLVESRHRCHLAVMDAGGTLRHAWGNPDLEIYPRSAIKPIQTLALIETGTAGALGLTDERIALAAASHGAAPAHLMALEAWLGDLDLGVDALECGAQAPMDGPAREAMIKRGVAATRLHHNCSGKHLGFLATAGHLGEAQDGYLASDHPVQRRLYRILEEMGDCALAETARGVDGCGIPVYGMPLAAVARAAARMADPDNPAAGLAPGRAAACRRVVGAMVKHAFMVAGKGFLDTVAMTAGAGVAKRSGRPVFATKTGAEAAHLAILPGAGADGAGLGVALKVEDGSKRASDAMIAHVLDWLGSLDDPARDEMAAFLDMPVTNAAGDRVGCIAPEEGWHKPA